MDLHLVAALSLSLLQQMCVYLIVAYVLSRTRLFIPLTRATIRWPQRLTCYLIFSAFCIMGTLIGALIIGFLNNALNLLDVSSYYQMIAKASVILLAVMIDNKSNR